LKRKKITKQNKLKQANASANNTTISAILLLQEDNAGTSQYTLCLAKKHTNFETVYLKIIMLIFDDIWLKYSKDSEIELACFSFHVGLLSYQLFVFPTRHQ